MPSALARLAALIGLIVLAVPMGLIAIAVRLDSPGPILYRAVRVGRHGHPFTMLKFRTMRVSAEGPPITAAGDDRVTRVGARLRRHRLDEFPQLWNVIVGTMAPVGPRPEDPRYVDLDDPIQMIVLSVLPGITGPSQLAFRGEAELLARGDLDEIYRTEILPAKLEIDRRYVDERSFLGDLRYVAATLRAMIPGHGDQ